MARDYNFGLGQMEVGTPTAIELIDRAGTQLRGRRLDKRSVEVLMQALHDLLNIIDAAKEVK